MSGSSLPGTMTTSGGSFLTLASRKNSNTRMYAQPMSNSHGLTDIFAELANAWWLL